MTKKEVYRGEISLCHSYESLEEEGRVSNVVGESTPKFSSSSSRNAFLWVSLQKFQSDLENETLTSDLPWMRQHSLLPVVKKQGSAVICHLCLVKKTKEKLLAQRELSSGSCESLPKVLHCKASYDCCFLSLFWSITNDILRYGCNQSYCPKLDVHNCSARHKVQ